MHTTNSSTYPTAPFGRATSTRGHKYSWHQVPHLYLGICPHNKVLQLNDLIVYRWPITLLDDVVSCSPLAFFRWFWLLDTPGNLFDRHLFLPHHHWHRGQNGPIAPNKGLQGQGIGSVNSNQLIHMRFTMVRAKWIQRIQQSSQSSKTKGQASVSPRTPSPQHFHQYHTLFIH